MKIVLFDFINGLKCSKKTITGITLYIKSYFQFNFVLKSCETVAL